MTRIATLALLAALCAGQAAPAQAAAKTVPFYIFIGQSNTGWLGALPPPVKIPPKFARARADSRVSRPAHPSPPPMTMPIVAGARFIPR